jgi:hypothetical protein
MQRCVGASLTLLALSQLCHGTVLSTNKEVLGINPPLKDVSSDKKFFGPSFPADYPDDKRPVIKKSIMDDIRSPEQPYPALQSRADFDADYVKDENSDTGAWKAQFEYDAARKRLMDEEGDEKRAQDDANRAGHDADDAQRNADDASKKAGDAQKGLDDAKAGEDGAGKDDGDDGSGDDHSAETLEELKKKLKDAEEAYEKQKKSFEECERQLKEAKEEYERLKAELAEMEKKAYSTAKLWAEQKTVRMTALKAKRDAEKGAAAAKTKAAKEVLTKAQSARKDADRKLAKEKSDHEQALENLQKQKADMEAAQKGLEESRIKLQKLRGYAPPGMKSGSGVTTAFSLLLLAVVRSSL